MKPVRSEYVKLLQIPSFTVLLTGRTISGMGHILYSMATMWYILQLTESAFAAAIIPMLPYLIYLFLGIPLSTISDRLPKKMLLIVTDLLRALIALGTAFLFITDHISPWQIYISNLLIAILGFLFNPAAQTVLPNLLPEPEKQLAPANGLLNAVSRSIELVGYIIGGIMVAFLKIDTILFVYAITFTLSALSFLFIHFKEPAIRKQKGMKGFASDSMEGIKFIFSKTILKYCVIFGAVINFVGAPLQIFTPIFSNMVLHAGSQGYGLLQSAFAAGSIVGALVSGKYAKKLKLAQWFVISYLITGFSLLCMPLFPNLTIALIFSFFTMFGLSLINVPLISAILLATPDHARGRVMNSLGVLMSGISNPLGLLLGGWLIEAIHPSLIYIAIGVFIMVMGLVSTRIKPFYDEEELQVADSNKISHATSS